LDQLSEEDIEEEIRAYHAARHPASRDSDPPAVKNG
jgi:hypothetical protein